MKKIYYTAVLFAAALLGFSACSTSDDIEIPEPETSVVGIVNGYDANAPMDIWMEGPSNISTPDGLYTFEVKGNVGTGPYTFTVEDTYFNDPKSYAVNVSYTGKRINVVFNDYGHYKITARNAEGKWCSYEVAKYYKGIAQLKYCSNAPTLESGIKSYRPYARWFERYANYKPGTNEFSGKMINFPQRIVVNVVQLADWLWFPWDQAPYSVPADGRKVITGIAAKGASQINLPDANIIRHPDYNSVTLDNNAYLIYRCADRAYSIPAERCGAL